MGSHLDYDYNLSSGPDFGCAIAADQNGNIYVTGLSYLTWGTPISPFGAAVGSGSCDVFVAKLSNTGVLRWNTFLGISTPTQISGYHNASMTLDRNGNIYIVCSSITREVYAAKLNSSGARQWLVALGSTLNDNIGQAIAVDVSGNVYVGGSSNIAWGTPIHPFNNGSDAFLAKLNANGVLQWNTFWGGVSPHSPGFDYFLGLAVDVNGNVYAAGKSDSTWGSPIRPYSATGWDAFVAKFNSSGALLWNTFLGSGIQVDSGNAIAVDSDGNAYVTGTSTGNWGSPVTPFGGSVDIFVAALNTSGILQWNAFFGSMSSEEGDSLTLDSSRNIYVAGKSGGSWGASERPFAGGDAFALKLDSNGNRLWNTFLGSSGQDTGEGIALDKVGNVFITGTSFLTWGNPINPFPGNHPKVFAAKIDVTDGKAVISTSKSDLYFGAVAGGAKSADQKFQISNIGAGLMDWTLTSNRGWLSCTPTTGYGSGLITVSVNPAGIPAGTTDTGAIQIASSLAYNSPQTVNVHLSVMAGGATAFPFGSFDSPLNGTQNITGAIPVTGWVLDDIGVNLVRIWRDAVAGEAPGNLIFIGDAILVEGARPDVEAAQPNYPLNSKAGWGYMLLTNFLPAQGNGIYKLYAYATDYEGNTVLLGVKIIACDNGHAVKPFGTIDTPSQGGDASGSAYPNFGWVLTPMPKTVPKNGSTIDVYVDSVKVGNLATAPNVYNQYRVDVATTFPGLNNSGGPVGAFFLDTTKLTNGVHTIYWLAQDDAGGADGIGSRYFNVINTGSAAQASSQAINLEKANSYESVVNLPVSFELRKIKRGFSLKTEPEIAQPDNYGTLHVEIKEVERIEVNLGKGRGYRGYLVIGEELRPLPIGSTLDSSKGTFSWLPGPGFVGKYEMVFLKEDGLGITKRIPIEVVIKPKF